MRSQCVGSPLGLSSLGRNSSIHCSGPTVQCSALGFSLKCPLQVYLLRLLGEENPGQAPFSLLCLLFNSRVGVGPLCTMDRTA